MRGESQLNIAICGCSHPEKQMQARTTAGAMEQSHSTPTAATAYMNATSFIQGTIAIALYASQTDEFLWSMYQSMRFEYTKTLLSQHATIALDLCSDTSTPHFLPG